MKWKKLVALSRQQKKIDLWKARFVWFFQISFSCFLGKSNHVDVRVCVRICDQRERHKCIYESKERERESHLFSTSYFGDEGNGWENMARIWISKSSQSILGGFLFKKQYLLMSLSSLYFYYYYYRDAAAVVFFPPYVYVHGRQLVWLTPLFCLSTSRL